MVGEEPVLVREEISSWTDGTKLVLLIETLLEEWDYVTIEKSPAERKQMRQLAYETGGD
jgi:hypothetical protein